MSIDVSSIINDPDFVQPFELIRVTVNLANGRATETRSAPVPLTGIVLPAKLDDINALPEGERRIGSIAVYSLTELKLASQESNPDGSFDKADEYIYNGDYYHLVSLRYYAQCVLWYGIATLYQRPTS